MNKSAFIISGLVGIIGLVTLIITRIIQLVMPMIGRVAFQTVTSGSYTPSHYHLDFQSLQIGSLFLIIVSIVLCFKFYKKD